MFNKYSLKKKKPKRQNGMNPKTLSKQGGCLQKEEINEGE